MYYGQPFWNQCKQCGKDLSFLFLAGVVASYWFLWLTRNDTVFEQYSPHLFLQILFREQIGSDVEVSFSEVNRRNNVSTMPFRPVDIVNFGPFFSYRWSVMSMITD